MTTIVAPSCNASTWQMGFNSAFKGLIIQVKQCVDIHWLLFDAAIGTIFM
jgi:hypothetical protein